MSKSRATSSAPNSAQSESEPPTSAPFIRSQSDPISGNNANGASASGGFLDLRTNDSSAAFSLVGGVPSAIEQEKIQENFENLLLTNLHEANEKKEEERRAREKHDGEKSSLGVSHASAFDLNDLVPFFKDGMDTIVQDGFSRCFERSRSQPWNWNLYLYPLWVIGVFIRYFILFPIRSGFVHSTEYDHNISTSVRSFLLSVLICICFISLAFLLAGLLFVLLCLPIVKFIPIKESLRASLQRKLIRFLCGVFVFSWTGVIKYHNTIPQKKPNQIYVANHTSMIDMIVLSQMNTFSMVGQKHPGWIGFMQTHVLGVIGTVWFQRGEAEDRLKSAKKIKDHIQHPESNRLLVFPEGTCVNNEYCVQFKQGVFDMGAEICPIAIKYNKIFVDGFWDSKSQSFQGHLATLMSSWCVVCDVWYLEPQRIQPGETGIAFSNRVKKMIAERAGLRNVSYDGYLKHFEVKQSLIEKQQKMYAEVLQKRLTKEEKEEIQREEAADAKRKAASLASPPADNTSASASGPDALAFSPSPEVPSLSIPTITGKAMNRAKSDPSTMTNVSSTANLLAMLNEVEKEEKEEATKSPTIRQRK